MQSINVELDVDFGNISSFADLARLWWEAALTSVGADAIEVAKGDLQGSHLGLDKNWAVKAYVGVSRPRAGGLRYGEKAFSETAFEWLLKQMEKPPYEAHITVEATDSTGRNLSTRKLLHVHVHYSEESPGWMRLRAIQPIREFIDPQRGGEAAWLEFVRGVADQINPSFGQIGYEYGLGKTALEVVLSNRYSIPDLTLFQTRRILRGYAWLTIGAEELLPRLGGVQHLRSQGAFYCVERLASGGVWMLATPEFTQYNQSRVGAVFRALAPALPEETPQRDLPWYDSTPLLVEYEDPRSLREC